MAYDRELFQEIDMEYEAQRAKNEQDLKRRQNAVFAHVPELEKIDSEIKTLGLKLYKIALSGGDVEEQISLLRKEQKSLQEKKEALLLANGYPKDELSERFLCELCHDTGAIGTKSCECFKRKLIEKAYQQSNLSALLAHQSFDTFDMSLYSEEVDPYYGISPKKHMEAILNRCRSFVQNFDKVEENLLFWGEPGLGKTFLSTCIAKELIAQQHSVIYETAYKTFSMLEELKFKKSDNEEKLKFKVDKLYSCDLLILDDLGSEFATQYTTASLFDIINSRLISGKKTLINTNLSMSELEKKYGERVVSRIFGHFKVMQFIGSDIRIDNSVNN